MVVPVAEPKGACLAGCYLGHSLLEGLAGCYLGHSLLEAWENPSERKANMTWFSVSIPGAEGETRGGG